MAKKLTIEVTPDEAEVLAAIREDVEWIASAVRRFAVEFPDGRARDEQAWFGLVQDSGILGALFVTLGEDFFWTPAVWLLFSVEVAQASEDPAEMARWMGEARKWSVPATAAKRDELRAASSDARRNLEKLVARMRGRHRAGRVKRVDEQATEDSVYRLAREIENRRGEERGSTRRAKAQLAKVEGVTPAALTKRITRRLG